jgi:hypothetical protein
MQTFLTCSSFRLITFRRRVLFESPATRPSKEYPAGTTTVQRRLRIRTLVQSSSVGIQEKSISRTSSLARCADSSEPGWMAVAKTVRRQARNSQAAIDHRPCRVPTRTLFARRAAGRKPYVLRLHDPRTKSQEMPPQARLAHRTAMRIRMPQYAASNESRPKIPQQL